MHQGHLSLDTFSTEFEIVIDLATRTVRPAGAIDAATAPLASAAARTFLAEFPGDLTVDLARVSFADSALITVVHDLQALLASQGEQLYLRAESSAVKRLFLAAGVTRPGARAACI